MLNSMPVTEYMRRDAFTLQSAMSVQDAVEGLLQQRLSSAPVVDDGTLVGVFSESDGLKGALDAGYHGTALGRVGDYMSREVQSVMATATVQEAAELFLRHHRRSMPVISGSRLVGQVSRSDILRAAVSQAPAERDSPGLPV